MVIDFGGLRIRPTPELDTHGTLRLITTAPWYVTIKNLHKLLTLNDPAKPHHTEFYSKLHSHTDPLIKKIILCHTRT